MRKRAHLMRRATVVSVVAFAAVLIGCSSVPAPPRIVGAAGSANEARMADGALSSSYAVPSFVLAPGVGVAAGEADAWRWPTVDVDEVADLAARLGVPGDPVAIPADQGGGWRVGGDTDEMFVNVSSGGSWWMSPQGMASVSVCTTPAVPVDPVDDGAGSSDAIVGVAECEPLGPGVVLPSDDELVATARGVFGDGAELSLLEASPRWKGLEATYLVDGVPSGVTGIYTVGDGGTSASGMLGSPERLGPYPTLSAEEALARIGAGGGYAMPMAGAGRSTGSVAGDVPVSSDSGGAGVDGVSGEGGGAVSPGFIGSGAVPAEDPTMSIEPVPEPFGGPDVVSEVVTLVSVERTFVPFVDVDGLTWALPGYRYTDATDSWWTAVAVTDEFFGVADVDVAEPPVTDLPEPMPIDAAPDVTVVEGSGASGPDFDADLGAIVGLPEVEAIESLSAKGLTVRVVERDGESFVISRDYRGDRVNLVVTNGMVVSATVY